MHAGLSARHQVHGIGSPRPPRRTHDDGTTGHRHEARLRAGGSEPRDYTHRGLSDAAPGRGREQKSERLSPHRPHDRRYRPSQHQPTDRLGRDRHVRGRRGLHAPLLFIGRKYATLLVQYQVRGRRHHLRGADRPDVLVQLPHRGMPHMRRVRTGYRHRRAVGHPQSGVVRI